MSLNNTKIAPAVLNLSLLFLRIAFGGMMLVGHGWGKITKYETLKTEFFDFFGMGSQLSLILAISAEVLCALLLIFGLFTRLALIPLIVTMIVAVSVHNWELFGKAEMGFLYLVVFIFLLLTGPGDHSVDYKMRRKSFY